MKHRYFTREKVHALFVLVLFGMAGACSSGSKSACDGTVLFNGDREFSFNANEETLLCGDEDRKDKDAEKKRETDGWRHVPFSQREFLLRKYLSQRGYHHSQIRFETDHLVVDPGARSRILDVRFTGVPDEFFNIGYIGWRSTLLQTSSLDDIESWTLKRLHSIGYPCAKLRLLANADTDIVSVDVESGPKRDFPEVSYGEEQPLKGFVMRRYDAFRTGERYDERLLALTSSRMAADGVVFKSYFTPSCGDDPFQLTHRVAVGEPRLLKIGVGADTESFAIGKISWRHGRLGSNASNLSAALQVSKLLQEVDLNANWYFNKNHPRTFIDSSVTVRRNRDTQQEYDEVAVPVLLAKRLDFRSGTLEAKAGPEFSFENTIDGRVKGGKSFYRFETQFTFTDYPYQVYGSNPREGFQYSISTSSIVRDAYTRFGAHQVRLTGTHLWNLDRYDPPRYVLGFRYGFNTVLTGANQRVNDTLPSSYYTYLGGEQSVRGFGRQELPLRETGSLTAAFTGFEFRAAAWLPPGFDPFFFADAGWIGRRNFDFMPTTYLSPGLGLRWQSPIGALRVTVAHGVIVGKDPGENSAEHFQFFLSLGQEF